MRSVLTIAGSDSSAGAGIQADLKTFAALGIYGTSAITAITAQNTLGVAGVHELPPDMVAAQIDAVVEDIRPDAVKTGMLSRVPIIETVAAKLKQHDLSNVVVDPVMVATSGDLLLSDDAVAALRDTLLPLCDVVTPNLAEAKALVGYDLGTDEDIRRAAEGIVAMGAAAAVIKGGHNEAAEAVDVLYDGDRYHNFSAPRIDTTSTHGTGCTFASAVAAYLALGDPLLEAVGHAKEYVTESLRRAYPVGHGRGPVHHFYRFWEG